MEENEIKAIRLDNFGDRANEVIRRCLAEITRLQSVEKAQDALRSENERMKQENRRYSELLFDLKESFENPENRGTHTTLQMCKYLNALRELVQSALNGGK